MERPYKIVAIAGKGLGLVATRDIKRGEVAVCEKTLLKCDVPLPEAALTEMDPAHAKEDNEYLAIAIKCLPKPEQQAILSLHTISPGKYPFLGIIFSNALPVNGALIGLFRDISRINHSCAPNAQYAYDDLEKLACVRVVSQYRIRKGDEITIDYSFMRWDIEDRRAKVSALYDFNCRCPNICAEAVVFSSDKYVALLSKTRAAFQNDEFLIWPEDAIWQIRARASLYSMLGIHDAREAFVWYDAWIVCLSQGDSERGIVFINKAMNVMEDCYGKEHPMSREWGVRFANPHEFKFNALGDWHECDIMTRNGRILHELKCKGKKGDHFEIWLWHPGLLYLRLIGVVQNIEEVLWENRGGHLSMKEREKLLTKTVPATRVYLQRLRPDLDLPTINKLLKANDPRLYKSGKDNQQSSVTDTAERFTKTIIWRLKESGHHDLADDDAAQKLADGLILLRLAEEKNASGSVEEAFGVQNRTGVDRIQELTEDDNVRQSEQENDYGRPLADDKSLMDYEEDTNTEDTAESDGSAEVDFCFLEGRPCFQ